MRAALALALLILCVPGVQAASPINPGLSISISPGDAAPNPKPTLSVELGPAEQSLNASYDPQEVTFSGRITLGNAPYAKYEVFLDACDSPGWAASCTPDYLTFWGDGSAEFNINVTVPGRASGQTCRIWVESRATYEDVDVAGNISGSVYLTVGKLPENPDNTNTGNQFFGGVSGGSGTLGVMLAAVVIFLVIGFVLGFVVWRWKRRKRTGNEGNDGQ